MERAKNVNSQLHYMGLSYIGQHHGTKAGVSYRQDRKHICIVVDAIPHAILALAGFSIQLEALDSTGQQAGSQAHFIFSEANGGEGGLDRGTRGDLA